MASLLRVTRPYLLPADAEVVVRDGRRHVRLTERGRAVFYRLSKDGTKYLKPSKKWYGQYKDADGLTCREPLAANKEAAQQMLAAIVKKVELEKGGVRDPFAAYRKKPLADHLAEYSASFADHGHTARQAEQAVARCRAAFSGCRFRSLADLDAEAVGKWLARRRELPKADGGFGTQTSNHYLTAVKAFANWCARTRRLGANPFQHLRRLNVAVDLRHRRRDLTDGEMAALLAAARIGNAVRGLPGVDRAVLYTVAAYTGLRASELASLTPASFTLDASPPTVCVEAGYSKHRRKDHVPLHPALVAELRQWLAGRPADAPLWPGNWAKHFEASDLIKHDLAAARTAWLASATTDLERGERLKGDHLRYRDAGGRVADFHALRHTVITKLVRAGVLPKDAKELARHSTITLTMDRYAHVTLTETAAAVGKLSGPAGGDAAKTSSLDPVRYAPPDAQAGDTGGDSMRSDERQTPESRRQETLTIPGDDGDCEPLSGIHPEGFEPPTLGSEGGI